MEEIRRQHEEDLKNNGGYVKLPSALAGNIPGPNGNGAGNGCFLRTVRTRKTLRATSIGNTSSKSSFKMPFGMRPSVPASPNEFPAIRIYEGAMVKGKKEKSPTMFRPHPWHGLDIGPSPPEILNVFVEITPYDLIKYEIDKMSWYLRVDRLPEVLIERLQHYFITYKLVPGESVTADIKRIYGCKHVLKVVNASIEDYKLYFGKYIDVTA